MKQILTIIRWIFCKQSFKDRNIFNKIYLGFPSTEHSTKHQKFFERVGCTEGVTEGVQTISSWFLYQYYKKNISKKYIQQIGGSNYRNPSLIRLCNYKFALNNMIFIP